ncbi:MAG: GNAT family N-acetyltransferase [Clostridia bacterium]|nr:GNAT family N-acetyltransferase [Clostridia bacterium]
MEYRIDQLLLRFVTEDDWPEVAKTWPADHHPLSEAEARGAIAYMQNNHGQNAAGSLAHLCFAVCSPKAPQSILGWCGLDGSRSRTEPELFVLLGEDSRNKGIGTACVRALLQIAAAFSLQGVHGGCDKANLASRRMMEKGGMAQYGTEENGDPLFRYAVDPK